MRKKILTDAKKIVVYLSVFSVLAASIASVLTGMDIKLFALGGNTTPEIWKGPENYNANKNIISYESGSGTATDPFLISNGDQLYKMVNENGKNGSGDAAYFRLTENIYLNDIASGTQTNNWSSVLTDGGDAFAGHFDGDGFTIYGLYSNNTADGSYPAAFIPYLTTGSTVSNLTISDSQIITNHYGGAVAGGLKAGNGTEAVISNCGITESVKVESLGSANGAAGIIGYITNCININNCYVYTKQLTGVRTGAFFADGWGNNTSLIENSLSVGFIPYGRNDGSTSKITYENVYTTEESSADGVITVSSGDLKGENAAQTLVGFDFESVWKMVDGSYPDLRKPGIWGGPEDIDTSWEGNGTKESPYLIYTPAELFGMMSVFGKVNGQSAYFALMNDIYLNDVKDKALSDIEDPNNWANSSINGSSNGFAGAFDGNRHVIYGLYAIPDGNLPSGLFSKVTTGAVIENIVIDKAYIETTQYAGAVVGGVSVAGDDTSPALISRCGVESDVKVISVGTAAAGGIVGYVTKATNIENCYSLAVVSSSNPDRAPAGIYGDTWGASGSFTVSNTYCVGFAPAGRSGASFINVYTDTANSLAGVSTLANAEMKGPDAVTNMSLPVSVWTVTANYPIIKVVATENTDNGIWDGVSTDTDWEGDGTENNPYKISTAAELYGMVSDNCVNGDTEAWYELTDDIYLNDTSEAEWYKNSPNEWYNPGFSNNAIKNTGFNGHIEGNGHFIYGLYYDAASQGVYGLLPAVCGNVSINNLQMKDVYINSQAADSYVGALVGIVNPTASGASALSITRCVIGEDVYLRGSHVGGLVGEIYASGVNIRYCGSSADFSGTSTGGALAGSGWSGNTLSIYNSYCVGTPSGMKPTCDKTLYITHNWPSDATTNVSEGDMKGEQAKITMPDLGWEEWLVGSGFPCFVLTEENEPFWEVPGSSEVEQIIFAGGSGTATDPYVIETADQLYKMVYEHGRISGTSEKAYYILANDIYLNDVSDKNITDIPADERAGWYVTTANNEANAFFGEIDGRGKTIYGLNLSSSRYAGLIPLAGSGASVKNLNIRKAHFEANSSYTGAVIGYTLTNSSVSISNCTVRDVYISGNFIGGIIGGAPRTTLEISNSAFMEGTLKTTNADTSLVANGAVGGIIEDGWQGFVTIENSYSIGYYPVAITSNTPSPALFSYSNVYTDTASITSSDSLSEEQKANLANIILLENSHMRGENAQSNMAFDWNLQWSTVVDDYPMPKVFDEYEEGTVGAVWSGKIAAAYAGGDGTKNNPYIIETPEQLYKMVIEHSVASDPEPGAYYELAADIYLNDVAESEWYESDGLNSWYSIFVNAENQGFSGNLDGKGHYVYGIYVKDSQAMAGLIPVLGQKATVRNVHVRNSYIDANNSENCYIGGIAGFVTPSASVEIAGCSVRDTYLGDAAAAGGIFGGTGASVIVDCCYFIGTFEGDNNYAGGIYADSWGATVVTDCYTVGSVMFDKSRAISDANRYSDVSQESSKNATGITVTVLDEALMKGDNAQSNMTGFDWTDTWYTVENDYPHLNAVVAISGTPGGFWSGKKAAEYAGGSGTENDPYQIATGEQLYKMIVENSSVNAPERWFVLIEDIKLNDVLSEEWATKTNLKNWYVTQTETAAFGGHFDGQGHVISGLYAYGSAYGSRGALFPTIDVGATIENVGIIHSSINMSMTGDETYGAALVAYVRNWDADVEPTSDNKPLISKCFADGTVSVSAIFAGGIVSGLPAPVIVENCYFNGTLDGATFSGAIIGNAWVTGVEVRKCYSAMQQLNNFVGGRMASRKEIEVTDSYTFGTANADNLIFVSIDDMRGENAKLNMPALDFENVWITVEGGTPVLRVFGENAGSYSDKTQRYSTIEFVTNVENYSIEPITGIVGSKLTLPTPVRYGYKFDGWYVYSELQCEYKDTTFPLIDLQLYAKWTVNSIIQDFEDYPFTSYDVGNDYVYYRPGTSGYDAYKVHGGSKALLRVGEISEESDFLLNYEQPLNVGEKYTMTFWMYSDDNDASGTLSLVHATWPDIAEANAGVEKMMSFDSIRSGEWKEYTYTFTAKTQWVSIRTTGGTRLFFDDFMLVSTGIGDDEDILTPPTGESLIALTAAVSAFMVSAVLIMLNFSYFRKLRNNVEKHENVIR